jgi:hypothetical protein
VKPGLRVVRLMPARVPVSDCPRRAGVFATAAGGGPSRLRFRAPGGRFRDGGRRGAVAVAVSRAGRAFLRRRPAAGRRGCGSARQAGVFATAAGGGPSRLRFRAPGGRFRDGGRPAAPADTHSPATRTLPRPPPATGPHGCAFTRAAAPARRPVEACRFRPLQVGAAGHGNAPSPATSLARFGKEDGGACAPTS